MNRPLHVLVVEDDLDIREAVGDLLDEDGFQVSCAGNGREALERLARDALPDVILLDLRMPVMDGWAFKAALDAEPRLRPIPVVVMSADSTAAQRGVGSEAGWHLRKPIAVDELLGLLSVVREHLWRS